ncbi:MAG: hypothetical protein ACXWK6_07110, partial [Myxococcaceae bacterium]
SLDLWSCSGPGQPPGIPEAARAAIPGARERARERPWAAQRGVLSLGPGKLRVQTLRGESMRCVVRDKVQSDEVWASVPLGPFRELAWLEAPQAVSRDRFPARNTGSNTLLYSRRTDPAPRAIDASCESRPAGPIVAPLGTPSMTPGNGAIPGM